MCFLYRRFLSAVLLQYSVASRQCLTCLVCCNCLDGENGLYFRLNQLVLVELVAGLWWRLGTLVWFPSPFVVVRALGHSILHLFAVISDCREHTRWVSYCTPGTHP